MEGIEDETSGWSDAFETGKVVKFIDLPLTMTIEHDLSALNSRPAHVRAVMQQESKVWGPETVGDIKLSSSMKPGSKDNAVLFMVDLETLACIEYSCMIFIPVFQALVADSESDLLKILKVRSTVERQDIYLKQKQSISRGWTLKYLQYPTI